MSSWGAAAVTVVVDRGSRSAAKENTRQGEGVCEVTARTIRRAGDDARFALIHACEVVDAVAQHF
jgi:hypothetical protein